MTDEYQEEVAGPERREILKSIGASVVPASVAYKGDGQENYSPEDWLENADIVPAQGDPGDIIRDGEALLVEEDPSDIDFSEDDYAGAAVYAGSLSDLEPAEASAMLEELDSGQQRTMKSLLHPENGRPASRELEAQESQKGKSFEYGRRFVQVNPIGLIQFGWDHHERAKNPPFKRSNINGWMRNEDRIGMPIYNIKPASEDRWVDNRRAHHRLDTEVSVIDDWVPLATRGISSELSINRKGKGKVEQFHVPGWGRQMKPRKL